MHSLKRAIVSQNDCCSKSIVLFKGPHCQNFTFVCHCEHFEFEKCFDDYVIAVADEKMTRSYEEKSSNAH